MAHSANPRDGASACATASTPSTLQSAALSPPALVSKICSTCPSSSVPARRIVLLIDKATLPQRAADASRAQPWGAADTPTMVLVEAQAHATACRQRRQANGAGGGMLCRALSPAFEFPAV